MKKFLSTLSVLLILLVAVEGFAGVSKSEQKQVDKLVSKTEELQEAAQSGKEIKSFKLKSFQRAVDQYQRRVDNFKKKGEGQLLEEKLNAYKAVLAKATAKEDPVAAMAKITDQDIALAEQAMTFYGDTKFRYMDAEMIADPKIRNTVIEKSYIADLAKWADKDPEVMKVIAKMAPVVADEKQKAILAKKSEAPITSLGSTHKSVYEKVAWQ